MTKAEIRKRIDENVATLNKVSTELFGIASLPSVSADATAISTVLLTINSTICDTMTTLALILCEMMPEEEDYNA